MKRLIAISLFMWCALSATAGMPEPAALDARRCDSRLESTMVCYRDAVERQPLVYEQTGTATIAGVERRSYRMTSQNWSPEQLVTPAAWQHTVAIYVPENPLPRRALLISTNGTRLPLDGPALPDSELSPESVAAIASRTRTVVIVLNDIPNQYLTYTDDGKARREDDSVAHTWALFLQSPGRREALPLHVPMAAALSRAMTLAERELASLNIHRFILAGASKRGWASWHALVADPRVDAVVPFVIDILDMQNVLAHIYRTYGQNWPRALNAYYGEGVLEKIETPEFSMLAQIQDPLNQLGTSRHERLQVPKYIVNASGDDFFVPDGSHFYYGKLPGIKSLRMVPNSSHYDIRSVAGDSLITFVNRLQGGQALPEMHDWLRNENGHTSIRLWSSERPSRVLLWSATNPVARDFRYACGIRYSSMPVPLGDSSVMQVAVQVPTVGWTAYFVEATYADGYVATSQAYVLGEQGYPSHAPPGDQARCTTLAGRGLGH
ncbi:PhoPQ-activated pathogenicity-related family protein [Paracidovorax anthurii]|uniref:PhoPQ-activated pathogenicity-related protein n=1 Tax=Paracidovorax anthurii TaxID=78229 RepID=A0A328YSY7_9BURK|nr:PhoPQ-activated protein PqaA family protein [Paracidovorax anthurii]RAR76243.1 PhoPQ-activated pathogenicity-related protein [Paracidovorax anthurii]